MTLLLFRSDCWHQSTNQETFSNWATIVYTLHTYTSYLTHQHYWTIKQFVSGCKNVQMDLKLFFTLAGNSSGELGALWGPKLIDSTQVCLWIGFLFELNQQLINTTTFTLGKCQFQFSISCQWGHVPTALYQRWYLDFSRFKVLCWVGKRVTSLQTTGTQNSISKSPKYY